QRVLGGWIWCQSVSSLPAGTQDTACSEALDQRKRKPVGWLMTARTSMDTEPTLARRPETDMEVTAGMETTLILARTPATAIVATAGITVAPKTWLPTRTVTSCSFGVCAVSCVI